MRCGNNFIKEKQSTFVLKTCYVKEEINERSCSIFIKKRCLEMNFMHGQAF